MIKENKLLTISKTALTIGSTYRSALAIVHNDLGYYKVCGRWIPPELTEEHKCTC
jgi:hypothetical protein